MALKDFALVIQGGGTRASFCLGVVEGFINHDIHANYVIGTSAGALIGMMYLIAKPKEVEEAFLDYMSNKQFVGLSNIIKKGTLFDFSFFYDDLNTSHQEIDLSLFFQSKAEYYAVATDCLNGQPAYFSKDNPDILNGIAASCALPLFSKPVFVNGRPYLDGGSVESIPFHKPLFENKKKIVVIASRPKGFKKPLETNLTSKLVMKARYGKYPEWSKAFLTSSSTYNREALEMAALEKEGRIFVIYPPESIPLKVAETDPNKLLEAIKMGRDAFEAHLESLQEYLNS